MGGCVPMPIGRGKIKIELHVTPDEMAVLDALQSTLAAALRRDGEAGAPTRSDVVSWLARSAMAIRDAEAEASRLLEAARRDRAEAARVLEEAREERRRQQAALEQRAAELAETEADLRRQTGLSRWALGLLADLGGQGLSREDILGVAELIRASGLDATTVASAMRRLDPPGLVSWARRLQQATADLQQELVSLREEVAAHQKARSDHEVLLREAQEQRRAALAEAEAARMRADRLTAAAEELGIYLPALGSQGLPLEALPEHLGRVLAGIVLLACVQAHGDALVRVPRSPERGRPIDVDLLLSEVPYVLAPKEAYERQWSALRERARRAEEIAASPPSSPTPAPSA